MTPQISLRILIAEDNPINQKLLLAILRQLGYQADVANNGREVLTAVEKTRYDVVFMDVHMPEMDGLEATRRMVDTTSASERPFIVAVTADALKGDRDKCIEAGMDDYISKPIRIADIQGVLERWGQKAEQKAGAAPVSPPIEEEHRLEEAVWDRIRQLGFETDAKFIPEFLELYVPLFESELNRLLEACAGKDSERIFQAAHSMKGASLNVGASEFGALCQSIEERARKNELEGLDSLLEDVKQQHARVVRALSAIKEKLDSSTKAS